MLGKTPVLVTAFSKQSDKGTINIYEKDRLPFQPKRIFWITDVPKLSERGGHAHKECEQFIFCVNGEVEFSIQPHTVNFKLGQSSLTALYLPPMNWLDIRFLRPNSKIVVLCSHEYNESEYIRTFDEFKRLLLENPIQ